MDLTAEGNHRPNILFLLSDQHTPAVTGCYGDPVVRTPNLDRLAAAGVRLTNLYCPSPLCTPSRMSLLTGRHPYQNEVWDNTDVLSSATPTYAHALGAAGYSPELIGKLHARGPDQLHGFVRRSYGDHGPAYLGSDWISRGEYDGTAGPLRVSTRLSGAGQATYDYRDEEVAVQAAAFLDHFGTRARAGIEQAPFCLTLGFLLPHPPYIAPRSEYEYYLDRVPPPRVGADDVAEPFDRWWRTDRGIADLSEDETRRSRAAYWALVDRLDQHIGTVLGALERNGLERDTLVVYSSDHGDHVGERGLFWKHTFYQDSVTVPGILRWPGVLPVGAASDRVCSGLDLTATLIAAGGGPALPGSSGRDLLPLLTGQTDQWDDVALAEGGLVYHRQPQRMIRRGDWKLCYYHGWPEQLYDLRNDPDERTNLAGRPEHLAVQDALRAELRDGWDPDEVAATMRRLDAEHEVLAGWYRTARPPEEWRWEPPPTTTRLDAGPADLAADGGRHEPGHATGQ